MPDTTAQSIAAATKQPFGLWSSIGECVAAVFFGCAVLAAMGLVFMLGNILTSIMPLLVFAAILWALGTSSGSRKRSRRKAW